MMRSLFADVFAFPPNRETLGGTAYFIVEKAGNVLVDCPAWTEETQQFFQQWGGVRWLFLTHRGGIGNHVRAMQTALNCEILIQEQEAYLLPQVTVTPFRGEFSFSRHFHSIWTPGHSPASSCLYWERHGGILFSGRHLLPNPQGKLIPWRTVKTFHWFRQLDSVAKLRDRFTAETLSYLCPGANTGFLRGQGIVQQAYQHLAALDLAALRQVSSSSLLNFAVDEIK